MNIINPNRLIDTEQVPGSVLIIDDDQVMVKLLKRIIEQDGCIVAEAGDGLVGLRKFEEFHPDIVLLDVMMPGLNGFEVCEQLRRLPGGERTAIILVTALNDEQAIEHAFEAGADDYISKPLRWSVLRRRVRRLLLTKRIEERAYFQASLLQQVHNAVIATDREGIITYWNQSAQTLFQWEPDEVTGQNINQVIFSGNPELIDHIRESVVKLGSWNGEMAGICKNGQSVPVHFTVAQLRDDMNQIIGSVSVFTDITEQKRVEHALIERESSSRHLFANNPLPMWVRSNQTLFFLDVNDAAIARYGYSREEFLGMQITSLYLPEEAAPLVAEIETHKTLFGQRRHLLKNGTVIDVELSSHLLEFSGQDAVLVVSQDITERKRAEIALIEERNLLQTLIDTVPDYIFIKDNQARFRMNNRAHLLSLDMTAQSDVMGKTDFDFFPQAQAEAFFLDEQMLFKTQEPLLNREEPATNRSTKTIEWHITTKAPLRDLNGQIIGLVGISHDITELKKAQEKLT